MSTSVDKPNFHSLPMFLSEQRPFGQRTRGWLMCYQPNSSHNYEMHKLKQSAAMTAAVHLKSNTLYFRAPPRVAFQTHPHAVRVSARAAATTIAQLGADHKRHESTDSKRHVVLPRADFPSLRSRRRRVLALHRECMKARARESVDSLLFLSGPRENSARELNRVNMSLGSGESVELVNIVDWERLPNSIAIDLDGEKCEFVARGVWWITTRGFRTSFFAQRMIFLCRRDIEVIRVLIVIATEKLLHAI